MIFKIVYSQWQCLRERIVVAFTRNGMDLARKERGVRYKEKFFQQRNQHDSPPQRKTPIYLLPLTPTDLPSTWLNSAPIPLQAYFPPKKTWQLFSMHSPTTTCWRRSCDSFFCVAEYLCIPRKKGHSNLLWSILSIIYCHRISGCIAIATLPHSHAHITTTFPSISPP